MADRQDDQSSRTGSNRSPTPEESRRASGSDSVNHMEAREDRGNRSGEGIGSSASRRDDNATEENLGAAEGADLGSNASGSRNINGSGSGMNSSSASTGHVGNEGLERDSERDDRGME